MGNFKNLRLCGGTFFVLFLEAKNKRLATPFKGRSANGATNPEILSKLILLFNINFKISSGRSFNTFTSDYKLCRVSDTPAVGFTDKTSIKEFENRILSDYTGAAKGFLYYFLDCIDWDTKGTWLVAALIDLIEADETISEDALFYVEPDGRAVTKSQLRNIECIYEPSFVFGVWFYIMTHVFDNTVGAETINDEFLDKKAESRAERKFVSNIGQVTANKIHTSIQELADDDQRPSISIPREALPEDVRDMPFAMIQPGVAAAVDNIKNGDIFVNGKQVFYLDGENHETLEQPGPIEKYLDKVIEFYSKIKTLLYSEVPHDFDEIYEQNDVVLKNTKNEIREEIQDISIENLVIGNYGNIIIRGTGGIGKSMMMRHLALFFAHNYREMGMLPVLVPLKNFNDKEGDLEQYIFHVINNFNCGISSENFQKFLDEGKCLILLDGLDEIPVAHKRMFDEYLYDFSKAFQKSHIVISSRPNSNFVQYDGFLVFDIKPFSKAQAIELIDKLEYHTPEVKEKFKEDLEHKLFDSHKQFASNPLLLTIMLMTYTSYGEVPAKMHIFYAKAYETMARLHDASKGAYVRPLHTGLTPEDFAIYFSEFCARTYREGILQFDEMTFISYMRKVIKHMHKPVELQPRDFLLDLTENLCIMYQEGEYFYFIHRSFQEYFSAVFFSSQMDDQLERIGEFFENQRTRLSGDIAFDMLYDMIPIRVQRYIFLPFLKKLWMACGDGKDGYWNFLKTMYGVLYIQVGETEESAENPPESYIYNFIVGECLDRPTIELQDNSWPNDIYLFLYKTWVEIPIKRYTKDNRIYIDAEIKDLDLVDDKYIEENGEPESVGFSWEINVSDLINNGDKYKDMMAFIESDSFPMKQEYEEMRKYTEHLDQEFNSKPSSDDWFDAF